MNLLLVTALWRRPELTKIILDYYTHLLQDNVNLLCVGSEGEQSKRLAESAGWNYIEAPNIPLSQKCNALFMEAQKYNPDAVIHIGSDDLVSFELINYYRDNYNSKAAFYMGLSDVYFYCIETHEEIYFGGFGTPHVKTLGAGRIYSRYILNEIGWQPWADEKLPRGLDCAFSNRLYRRSIKEKAVSMQETKAVLIDFKLSRNKHVENLTPFHRMLSKGKPSTGVAESIFPKQFNQIKQLKLQTQ